jgi:hypothetical protein
MIGSVLVLVISAVLFVYWFRYVCLLMLQTKPVVDYTSEVVAANGLSLPDVLARLQEQVGDAQLATFRESLDRDYRLLAGWLSRRAKLQAEGCALEHRLLMIDYAIVRVWYAVARRLSHSRAQQALTEMAEIVGHFAGVVGELTAARSAARSEI